MKITFFVLLITLLIASNSYAKFFCMDDFINSNSTGKQIDPNDLIKQIRLMPFKTEKNGQGLAKVISVSKESVFDQAGIKIGDIGAFGKKYCLQSDTGAIGKKYDGQIDLHVNQKKTSNAEH